MSSMTGCGYEWPEWAHHEQDPLAFIGDNDGDPPDAPRPPSMIPAGEPDQTDEAFKMVPMTTMGVNLETYFLQDIKDPVTRIQRLENVMMAMHKDLQNLSGITPPQKHMAQEATGTPQSLAQNADIVMPEKVEGVMAPELEQGTSQVNPAAATQEANAPPQKIYKANFQTADNATAPPQQIAEPVAEPAGASYQGESSGWGITGIRVGEHPDKIRIVFDSTTKVNYKADLDNNEHVLVVEIPDTPLVNPNQSKSYGNMPVLDSLRTESMNDKGAMAIFVLKKDTKIISQSKHPAISGDGERIVIDLSK